MCFYCPQNLQPPNEQIQKCRLLAKIMAGALFILSIIALTIPNLSQCFNNLVMIYLLYIAWGQFDYSVTLLIFGWSGLISVFWIIDLIGIISKGTFNDQSAVLIILSSFTYPNIFYFSHEVYKKFKQLRYENGMLRNNYFDNMNRNINNNENFDDYQNMRNQQLQTINRNYNQNQYRDQPNNFFRGRGIQIG